MPLSLDLALNENPAFDMSMSNASSPAKGKDAPKTTTDGSCCQFEFLTFTGHSGLQSSVVQG